MAFIYDAPLVNPLNGGLFSAATMHDHTTPSRLFDGVKVRTFNCGGGYGTWGLGCVVTAVEVQNVTLTGAISGTFTLTFEGETTDPIPYDATPAQVQAALNALPAVSGVGGVTVTGTPGDWTITFNQIGDRSQITIDCTAADAATVLALGATTAAGGTFAAGTYYWVVTALGPWGESDPSNEVTIALALNDAQELTWTAVPDATGYRVYRSTVSGTYTDPALVAEVGAVTTYTDTGTATIAGAPPAATGVVCGESTVSEGSGVPKDGDRHPDDDFDGFAVWAADECGLKNRDEAAAAAQQTLRLREQELVEAEFAAKLIADAGVIAAPSNGDLAEFVRAVGELEAALGNLPGVIHADRHFAAWAKHLDLLTGPGGAYTPSGHRWAFGAGYAALGDNLIATGPVTVHRGSVAVKEGLDWVHNSRLMIAEREYAVSYECVITGREVAVVV